MISYCSKECQVKDWPHHKTFCVLSCFFRFDWQNQVIGYDPVAKAKEEEEKRLKEAEKSITMSLPPPRKLSCFDNNKQLKRKKKKLQNGLLS